MTAWRHCAAIFGLSAACAMVVLAYGAVRREAQPPFHVGALTPHAESGHAGSASCGTCHPAEASAWRASQHARAMQPATSENVLGDFSDARAEHFESRARFYQKDGRFLVETEGKDGKTASFSVDYTFGVEPLQQYLTTFPDGRIQALPYAWVTTTKERGGQRWIHLHPDEAIPPGDALHWTGAQQNWNFMCADCHSTSVRKGYEAETRRFTTTFSEVSVGCEACHGKASSHVAWATEGRPASAPMAGFASRAAKRPAPDWTPDPVTGSPAQGVARPAGDEVETCGACHASRWQFAEGWQPGKPLMDFYRPSFLTPDLFEADGQMRAEVFNYASFQQSKMHAKGVVCSDCHDPHSGKLKAAGSDVCAQCHAPTKFTSVAHTGHASSGASPDCIACHMPARTYMVVDTRHDHGFRVPRPDLSVSLGAPNACNDCHRDKPAAWAAQAIERWHGPSRKGFQTYAPAFHAAATNAPEARDLLLGVVANADTPALGRASALHFLKVRPSIKVDAAMREALGDPDPMVRVAALEGHEGQSIEQLWRRASHLLSDPVRAVRLQAASLLADGPPAHASPADKKAFEDAAAEYIAAERFNADRPESRANLARFYRRQGKFNEAEQEYLAALDLDFSLAPRIDLADLYRAMGREADGELLLRQTISIAPHAAAPHHALGLALIRAKRYDEALEALRRATELDATHGRYAYVYAIALGSRGQSEAARRVLEAGLTKSPNDVTLLGALLQSVISTREFSRALPLAERLSALQPDDAATAKLAAKLKAMPAARP